MSETPGALEVATRVDGSEVTVRFDFDAAGDVTGIFAVRPRLEHGKAIDTPWVGAFSGYDVVGGIRIPTEGQVGWELPEGPFTYWRGRVRSFETHR